VMLPGYTDTGASASEKKQDISFSAYTPPSPKKKRKVERTRFHETTRGFRQKSPQSAAPASAETAAPAAPAAKDQKAQADTMASMKPGKKEKIRFGQAPTKTLPKAASGTTEDAGAVQVAGSGQEPENPLESAPAPKKTRFSDRARVHKEAKGSAGGMMKAPTDADAPPPPDAGEVADRQTQSAPLGPADPNAKKKKNAATASEKTRMSDRKKAPQEAPEYTPGAPATGAPGANGAPPPPATPQPPQ
jgi:peptidyl-prolyl cis-trans isomerase SurA